MIQNTSIACPDDRKTFYDAQKTPNFISEYKIKTINSERKTKGEKPLNKKSKKLVEKAVRKNYLK